MLQKIHDKVSGWFAGLLLLLLAVVFVFWGIDFGFNAANYAAKVDGETIPTEDVRRAYQNQLNQFQQMYQGEVPEAMRAQIQNNVLEAFVRNELMVQRSSELGYRVSDEEVLKSYEQIPAFQIDGKFSHELAMRRLQTEGMSPASFEAQQRRAMQATQLQDAIAASAFVTPAELERQRLLQNEEREAAWVVIPAAHFAGAQPTEADIKAYYEAHKQEYKTPETVNLKYVELNLDDVAKDVKVADADLQAYFATIKDRYATPERRRARHILVQVEAPKDASTEAAARKKAEELLAKAKAAGADFAKLAQEHSEDAGSAKQGGDLGWSDRGSLVGPFADAVFDMKPNEIRGPVRSEFGYHIIRLEGIQEGKQKSLDEVRAQIEQDYRRQEAEKLFGERQEKLADKAFEKLNDLGAVARELGLTVKEAPGFRRDFGGGEFLKTPRSLPKVIEAAFSENVLGGENSQPVELAPGHVVVLSASGHQQPAQRPLTEVREAVVTAVKTQQSEAQAKQLAEQSAARLTAGSEAWGRLDTELKLKSEGPKFVTRAESALPDEIKEMLFSLQRVSGKPVYKAVTLSNGDAAVLAYSHTRAPQGTETPEEQAARARQLAARVARSEVAAYVGELRREAKVSKNAKVFE